jgi:aminopeptidase N
MKTLKWLLVTVLLFFVFSFSICAQNNTNIDVTHYRFDLTISDNSDTLYGIAVINFTCLKNSSSVNFDLGTVDSSGKGMQVIAVTGAERKLPFHHHNNKLLIQLPKPLKMGDSMKLLVHYKGIPADGLIIGQNSFNKRTFFGDNWPNRAHYWLPCNDIPADKASLEFIITAPAHYSIVSNGIKLDEHLINDSTKLTHWKEDVPLPTKVMVFGAADFAVSDAAYAGDIPVTSWVFAQEKTFYDYVLARDILQFYINYIGPYGYKKLANVQSKTRFGGMENAGAIFYFEESVSARDHLEDLLAHEIAHQWFGDMVTETDFKHLWLSEGFATYMTNLYTENRYGRDSMNKKLIDQRNNVIAFAAEYTVPVIDTTADYMKLLNANSYQKGGWVLHMLRGLVGDEVFKNIIREQYRKFAGKNSSTEDFIATAETVSKQNLQSFFEQWLYKPGLPVLAITWTYNERKKKAVIIVEQKQDGLFSFPLELLINTGDGKELKKLTIKKRRSKMTVRVNAPVTGIITDPNYKLLWKPYPGSVN